LTDAERLLWSKLRLKQINGCQFYRQKPVGKYIADFYCPIVKLVIEVDGGQHFLDEHIASDKVRDEYMQRIGLKVLRFTNVDVLTNISGVIDYILNIIENKADTEKIPLIPPFQKGENTASPICKEEDNYSKE
jgi:very-short-patch-repair endonuclease